MYNNMNNKISLFILLIVLSVAALFLACCSKENSPSPSAVASLNVVNALPTSAPLILVQGAIVPEIDKFSGIGALSYASTAVLTPMSGSETLYAVQKNVDTFSVNAQGGGTFMFDGSLSFAVGSLYSLFITGADTSNPDFVFVQDTVAQRTDSTAGIRFVNLSAGSNPVSIDIQGQAIGGAVSSLAYKGITSFMSFPATSAISSYVFEFRDAASGGLLASYTLSGVNTNSPFEANTLLFRNLTIALIGQSTGGIVPQTCIRVNSF
jgi:hypothetical protein